MTDLMQPARRLLNTLLCAALLCGFYFIGTAIAMVLPLPITGPLYGLGLLLACLFIHKGFAQWLASAAAPLLKHMVFFFIPAVMGVTLFADIILEYAWAFFIAVVITTVISMGITGWVTQKWLAKVHTEQ